MNEDGMNSKINETGYMQKKINGIEVVDRNREKNLETCGGRNRCEY